MKKIVVSYKLSYNIWFFIYDSTDYLIIQDNNQHIDDKYVGFMRRRFNQSKNIKKDDAIIRWLYYIKFQFSERNFFSVCFENFKHYDHIEANKNTKPTKEIKANLNSNESIVNFDDKTDFIIKIFSMSLRIEDMV